MCSIGLWIAVQLFGSESVTTLPGSIATYLLAGLIFSMFNSVIRPIITLLSLPFVLVTMGLFILVINGFLVWLTIAIAPNIHMTFGWSIVSSLILSLINYLISNFSSTPNYIDENKKEDY